MDEGSKSSWSWAYLDYSFKGFCVGSTLALITWCCYLFSLDEDATVVSFHQYYLTKNDIYPAISYCITTPYEQQKLDMYARNVTAETYSDFLSGHIWSDDLLKIDYESVVLNPSDYVLGYVLHYRNTTRVVKTYNSTSGVWGKQADIPLPTIRVVMSNMVCFGIDVPFEKNTWTFDIKVKTKIFKDGIRPNYMHPLTNNRGLGIIIHYPKQIFRSKWWINYWPTRHVNDSKNYVISYDIRGMEVVRYRNKRSQSCIEGFPDYDDTTLQEIIKSVGCYPPYSESKQNITMCTNSKDLKSISFHQVDLWAGDNLNHLPCSGIEKVNTDKTELDEDETTDPYFTISSNVKDLTYKEIKMKKAYDIWVLIGNVGGFIGLFLGYALMMFPGFLRGIILHFRTEREKRTIDTSQNKSNDNRDLNELRHKVDHISQIMSHLHDEVAFIRDQMSHPL